jgi:hypothetical protein
VTDREQDVSEEPSNVDIGLPGWGIPFADSGNCFHNPLFNRLENVPDGTVIASPFVGC